MGSTSCCWNGDASIAPTSAAKTTCAISAPPSWATTPAPTTRGIRASRWISAGNARIVLPSQGGYSNNAACVGGGTATYGAMAWRFHPKDFRMKSEYGCPDGSTLDDWPISYDDLEPYYEKAEREIGVSGDDSANPFKGPRRKPLPMPPLPADARAPHAGSRRATGSGCTRSTSRWRAIRCRTTDGRRACAAAGAWASSARSMPRAARRTPWFRPLSPPATASCARGPWSKRSCSTSAGAPPASPTSTNTIACRRSPPTLSWCPPRPWRRARLLLNSRHRLFPNGLGNRYDWVGRNFQGHTYSGAVGRFDAGGLRRSRPRRRHRHQRLQSRQSGTARWRRAVQRIHPPARCSSPASCRPARRVGAPLQERHARIGTSAPSPSRGPPRRCRSSLRASTWTPA